MVGATGFNGVKIKETKCLFKRSEPNHQIRQFNIDIAMLEPNHQVLNVIGFNGVKIKETKCLFKRSEPNHQIRQCSINIAMLEPNHQIRRCSIDNAMLEPNHQVLNVRGFNGVKIKEISINTRLCLSNILVKSMGTKEAYILT